MTARDETVGNDRAVGQSEAVGHYVDAYRALPVLDQPWLRELRRAGLERFKAVGFPSRRDEGWKYTDVRPIARRKFRVSSGPADAAHRGAVEAAAFGDLACHRLVFCNGRFSPSLSAVDTLPAGVRLGSLNQLLAEGPDELESAFSAYSPGELGSFAALNTAFLLDGAYLRLDADTLLPKPIHLLFLSVQEEHPVVSHPHLRVVAGAGSKATIIEHYLGLDDARNFTNAATVHTLAPGAEISHYKLQQQGAKALHVSSVQVHQLGHSRYVSHNVDLGGLLVRHDLQTDLADRGAEIRMNGLYMAKGRQHVDNHTRVDHRSPETRSEQCYKGILNGHARAVFNGKVVVHAAAQKTDAQQENHNLLLSDHAEVDTKPELEIYADDVKCSHGATTGSLDANSLFYLRSRGLDEETARGLLTFAFAEDVVDRLELLPLRKMLEREVIEFLPQSKTIEAFV